MEAVCYFKAICAYFHYKMWVLRVCNSSVGDSASKLSTPGMQHIHTHTHTHTHTHVLAHTTCHLNYSTDSVHSSEMPMSTMCMAEITRMTPFTVYLEPLRPECIHAGRQAACRQALGVVQVCDRQGLSCGHKGSVEPSPCQGVLLFGFTLKDLQDSSAIQWIIGGNMKEWRHAN